MMHSSGQLSQNCSVYGIKKLFDGLTMMSNEVRWHTHYLGDYDITSAYDKCKPVMRKLPVIC